METPSTEKTETSGTLHSGKPERSLGDFSKLIRSRTTDFIAIAIVVILGVTVGGQIIQWWWVDQSDVIKNPLLSEIQVNDWNMPGEPTSIQFGSNEIVREFFQGNLQGVMPKIHERCFSYTVSCIGDSNADPAIMDSSQKSARAGEDAKKRNDSQKSSHWLEEIRKLKPMKIDDQGHAIFQVKGPFPLIIGVLHYEEQTDSSNPKIPEKSSDTDQVKKKNELQIACIASYAQFGPDTWMLTISKSANVKKPESKSIFPPVPENCVTGLSLINSSGNAIIQFTGDINPEECWSFYRCWAEESQMLEEKTNNSPEHIEQIRVYKSTLKFNNSVVREDEPSGEDKPALKPIPEKEFSPQSPLRLKVIIQVRRENGKLHGMIHTFPLKP